MNPRAHPLNLLTSLVMVIPVQNSISVGTTSLARQSGSWPANTSALISTGKTRPLYLRGGRVLRIRVDGEQVFCLRLQCEPQDILTENDSYPFEARVCLVGQTVPLTFLGDLTHNSPHEVIGLGGSAN